METNYFADILYKVYMSESTFYSPSSINLLLLFVIQHKWSYGCYLQAATDTYHKCFMGNQ